MVAMMGGAGTELLDSTVDPRSLDRILHEGRNVVVELLAVVHSVDSQIDAPPPMNRR